MQYWSDKDAIPLKRVQAVIAAAQREGFDVTLEECLNVQQEPAA
jgi:hypothetical protein